MEERQIPLKENEFEICENVVVKIKPIKMKYIVDGFYGYYVILKKFGLMKLLSYVDGKDVLNNFLVAVFDDNQKIIIKLLEELTELKMKELVIMVKNINELDDEEEDLKNV